jgi:hypothetical protein
MPGEGQGLLLFYKAYAELSLFLHHILFWSLSGLEEGIAGVLLDGLAQSVYVLSTALSQ